VLILVSTIVFQHSQLHCFLYRKKLAQVLALYQQLGLNHNLRYQLISFFLKVIDELVFFLIQ
jgi:hypothetical protein